MKAHGSMKVAALAACLWLGLSPLIVLAADVRDGSTPSNGLPSSGGLGATWNGSSHKVTRGNASGDAYVQNSAAWEWQVEGLNLRNNQNINAEFVSQVLDVRKFGTKPTLVISWPGGTEPLYVAVDYLYQSSVDSTGLFRPRLGGSDPRGVGPGTMRTLTAGAVSTDSLTSGGAVRSTWAIAADRDSAGRELGWAPYIRVHIYSDGSNVPGVYAHLLGKP